MVTADGWQVKIDKFTNQKSYAQLHTRGVQKVLQLLYKKEPQTFKHAVIFEYSLLQPQSSFGNFLLSCLFLEKRILSHVPKTTLQ